MQAAPVPYAVHEADMARMERNNKKLWITNIILILAIFASVIWFFWRESQFEDVVTTIQAEQETEEGNNYAVVGDIIGTAESNGNG